MSVETYVEKRKEYEYYKVLRSLLRLICRSEDTICDVGSGGIDLLSELPCKRKVSIDLAYPVSNEEVEGVKVDYLSYEISGVDIMTCFQVLEHFTDECAEKFAKKLLREGRIVIVSVPYMWPENQCEEHVQDPMDVEKLISWFGKNPAFLHVVTEKVKLARIIAIFIQDYNPDIDLEYWREDAERALKLRLNRLSQLNGKRRFYNRINNKIRRLCSSIIKKR